VDKTVPGFACERPKRQSLRVALKLEAMSGVDPDTFARARQFVENQRTLEEVTRDALSRTPARFVSAVIPQDEFTHDVVLPFDDAYLVYDAT
jgi:hypothetical protein